MEERDLCDGCGRETLTVHGLCSNCWYPKQPERVPSTQPQTGSFGDLLISWLTDLAWLFPGAALIVLDLVVLNTDIALAIGIVALIGGGGLAFGDFVTW